MSLEISPRHRRRLEWEHRVGIIKVWGKRRAPLSLSSTTSSSFRSARPELREVQVKSITLEMLYVKLNFSASLACVRSGRNRPSAKLCNALRDEKSVFYRGEKSVTLFESMLRSADEKARTTQPRDSCSSKVGGNENSALQQERDL